MASPITCPFSALLASSADSRICYLRRVMMCAHAKIEPGNMTLPRRPRHASNVAVRWRGANTGPALKRILEPAFKNTNHHSRLAKNRILPETVNRVETHATHRKQTTAHTLTRNVPAHQFLHQSFALCGTTPNPCRAEDPGATIKSRCLSAPLAASYSARALQASAGPHPRLRPRAALGYNHAAMVSIRRPRRAVCVRCGGSRDSRNAIARRHVPVSLECPRRGDGASIFLIRWGELHE